MTRPAITILVPVYNGEHFIVECIKSIIMQDIGNLHIVVSDNASTDQTIQRVRSVADPRIELIQQSHNLGAHANMNWLLDHAEGDVVSSFCADDVMLPGHLKFQLAKMRQFPQAVLYGCDLITTDAQLGNRHRRHLPGGLRRGTDLTRLSLASASNLFGGPSNFMWRGAQATARYDPAYKWLSDLKYASQTVGDGLFCNTGRPGYLYRRHDASDTSQSCPVEVQWDEWRRLRTETPVSRGGTTAPTNRCRPGSWTRVRRRWACSPQATRARQVMDLLRGDTEFFATYSAGKKLS